MKCCAYGANNLPRWFQRFVEEKSVRVVVTLIFNQHRYRNIRVTRVHPREHRIERSCACHEDSLTPDSLQAN